MSSKSQAASSSKLSAWIEALRLRTLPLAAAGVILAAGIALHAQSFKLSIFIPMLIMALLLQILSNFADELGDLLNGVDDEDRLGPIRGLQRGDISKKEMIAAVALSSILSNIAALVCLYASFGTSSPRLFLGFFVLELICIAAAILYTVGPKPYGYIGLGDLMCFLFFGIVAVLGGVYLYTHSLNWSDLIAAIALGLPVIAVININNMRDAQTDKAKGKRSMANLLGDPAMRYYQLLLLCGSITLFLVFRYLVGDKNGGSSPWYAYFFILAALIWLKTMPAVIKIKDPKIFDKLMKPTAGATVLISLLLSLSLALF